jgi:uncharacterized coiled-coil protein SlyX
MEKAQPRIDTATLIKACRALEADCDVANLVSITIHFSGDIKSDSAFENSVLSQIADRLEEQEATIKVLRAELVELTAKAMSQEDTIRHLRADLAERTSAAGNHVATIRHLRAELCNASAVAMGHAEAVKTFREELDLLNKRPKR